MASDRLNKRNFNHLEQKIVLDHYHCERADMAKCASQKWFIWFVWATYTCRTTLGIVLYIKCKYKVVFSLPAISFRPFDVFDHSRLHQYNLLSYKCTKSLNGPGHIWFRCQTLFLGFRLLTSRTSRASFDC